MSTYSAVILADSPVAYWRFEEASGTVADSSGNSHNSTAVTNVTYNVTSSTTSLEKCFTFADGQIVIPDSTAWDLGTNFSVEFWMKTTTVGTYVLHKLNDWIYVSVQSNHKLWFYFWGTKSIPGWHESNTSVDDGNWHHVVLTVGTTTAPLWIDGVLDGTFTIGTGSCGTSGTGDLFLGHYDGQTDSGWTGQLDEVAIYNYVLNSTKVAAHFAASIVIDVTPAASVTNIAIAGQAATGGQVVNVSAAVTNIALTTFEAAKNPIAGTITTHGDNTSQDAWTYDTMANVVKFSQDVVLTGISAASHTGGTTRIMTGKIWSIAGSLLGSTQTRSEVVASNSTLYLFTFASPVSLTANTFYKIGFYTTNASSAYYVDRTIRGAHTHTTGGLISTTAADNMTLYTDTGSTVPVTSAGVDTEIWMQYQVLYTPFVADVTNNADVTNIAVAGQAATVAIHSPISATVTNVNLIGLSPTLIAQSGATISAAVSNITTAGYAAGFVTNNANVVADVTNINTIGYDAVPTMLLPFQILATVANIGVDGRDSLFFILTELYTETIAADNPTHWYRFDNNYADSGSANAPLSGDSSFSPASPITGTTDHIHYSIGAGGSVSTANTPSNVMTFTGTHGCTTEFWINTNQAGTGAIFSFVPRNNGAYALNYTGSAGPWAGNGYRHTTTYTGTFSTQGTVQGDVWGIVNGYLAKGVISGSANNTLVATHLSLQSYWSEPPNHEANKSAVINAGVNLVTWVTVTNKFVADGQWHHVVLSTVKAGDVYNNAAYVDGVQLGQTLPWGSPFWNNYEFPITIGAVGKTFAGELGSVFKAMISSVAMGVDEVATYDYGLTQADALEHYNQRFGKYDLDPNPIVEPDEGHIGVSGEAPTLVSGWTVLATVANVRVDGGPVVISGLGSKTVGSDTALITVSGQANILTTGKVITITMENNIGNIGVRASDASVRSSTNDLSFKFVPSNSIVLSTEDTETLTGVNLGAFLFAQSKTTKFKLGNTSLFTIFFTVKITSSNEELIPHILLSLDDRNYYSLIQTGNVLPKQISDTIYVKVTIPPGVGVGDGNILINVEPTNVN